MNTHLNAVKLHFCIPVAIHKIPLNAVFFCGLPFNSIIKRISFNNNNKEIKQILNQYCPILFLCFNQ